MASAESSSGESEEKEEEAEGRTADSTASREEELLLDAVEKEYGAFNWDLEDDPELMQKLKS